MYTVLSVTPKANNESLRMHTIPELQKTQSPELVYSKTPPGPQCTSCTRGFSSLIYLQAAVYYIHMRTAKPETTPPLSIQCLSSPVAMFPYIEIHWEYLLDIQGVHSYFTAESDYPTKSNFRNHFLCTDKITLANLPKSLFLGDKLLNALLLEQPCYFKSC